MTVLISNQQKLAEWVASRSAPIDMAVAFWGESAIEQLGLTAGRRCRILLDLTSGASNPKVVRELLRLYKDNVMQVERLHAKAYITSTEVIVGSANASANGLGVEGKEASHWKELSLLSNDPRICKEAAAWFKLLWARAEKIQESHLCEAEIAWKSRRRQRPKGTGGDLLEAARNRPEELQGRRIFVNVVTDVMDKSDAKELKILEKSAGSPLYAFTNWPEIPVDAVLVGFTQYDGEQIRKDEPFIMETPKERRRGKFKFVTPGNLAPYEIGPLKEWKRRLDSLRKADPKAWTRNGGQIWEITEFVSETDKLLDFS